MNSQLADSFADWSRIPRIALSQPTNPLEYGGLSPPVAETDEPSCEGISLADLDHQLPMYSKRYDLAKAELAPFFAHGVECNCA